MCSDGPAAFRPPSARVDAAAPRGRRASLALAALLALAVPLAGCGKKGEPLPPLRPVPARTDGLRVQQRGLELLLELPYPKVTAAGIALPSLDRVELYEVTRLAPPEFRGPAGDTVGQPASAEPIASDDPLASDEAIASADATAPDAAAAPDDPTGEEPGAGAAETEPAAPTAPAATAPPSTPAPLDLRQFNAAAKLRLALSGPELSRAVVGDRIVFVIPLPRELPPVPQAHWFAVRTVAGADDRSELSNQASIVAREPPAPVAGLAAEARPDGVLLTWRGDGPEVVGYDVYRREAASPDFGARVGVAPAGAPTFLDTSARFGGRYIYAVTAVTRRAPVVESAIAEVREVDYRDRFAPPAPQGLVALTEEGLVRLAWEGVRAADLAGYRVLRAVGAGGAGGPGAPSFTTLTPEPIQAAEYIDRSVAPGTAYTWRVVAVDRSGNVSEAAEAGATAR